MADLNDLKKELGRSDVKNFIVGFFIFAFGAFIAWMIIADVDKSSDVGEGGMVILWILAGICLLLGGFMCFKVVQGKIQRSNGTHPLLSAIERNEGDFIVWMYEHVSSIKGGGSSHAIWLHRKDGKLITVTVKGKRVKELLQYLHSQFPYADLGYTDELAAKYKK